MEVLIRPIELWDDPEVESIIREVMTSYGLDRPGSALHDPEVRSMASAYRQDGSRYFVAEFDGKVVGGGGIGPLAGGEKEVCELRKMYVLPAARGKGIGKRLLENCLESAKSLGYRTCYLETLAEMTEARRLYERNGFQQVCAPMGQTGHCACDTWYCLELWGLESEIRNGAT